jgi:hypothetical protein
MQRETYDPYSKKKNCVGLDVGFGPQKLQNMIANTKT